MGYAVDLYIALIISPTRLVSYSCLRVRRPAQTDPLAVKTGGLMKLSRVDEF